MISECANDLLTRVRSVSALASRASFAIGGKSTDPSLKEIPLPAARLILMREEVGEDSPSSSTYSPRPSLVPMTQIMVANFSVVVIVPYADDNDILNVEFPLLESVISAVKSGGTNAPSGHRWRYIGQRLAFIYPDRLGYEQSYQLTWTLS